MNTPLDRSAPKTPVIFRKWPKREGGGIVALFPADAGDYSPYTCASYAHVGQHSTADPLLVMQKTKPAKPEEYAELKRELESPPYDYRFKIYQKLQRRFLADRRAQLAEIK